MRHNRLKIQTSSNKYSIYIGTNISDKIKTILNVVDINNFYPNQKNFLRKNYPIDIDKKIILLGATHLDRKYKGFHKFIEAISYLDPKDIEIVTFGEISKKALNKINNFSVTNLGIISSSKKLSSIYSSSYLFAAPSILEAFGKTIGESMLCGTPCVVFGNSGPSELIIHKYTGFVANNTCPKSFADGLKPIVINITVVTNKKLIKPISIFFFALSLPKCSDKISVHRKVEANNTVPNATGSGE